LRQRFDVVIEFEAASGYRGRLETGNPTGGSEIGWKEFPELLLHIEIIQELIKEEMHYY
jgi:hypothetical protein